MAFAEESEVEYPRGTGKKSRRISRAGNVLLEMGKISVPVIFRDAQSPTIVEPAGTLRNRQQAVLYRGSLMPTEQVLCIYNLCIETGEVGYPGLGQGIACCFIGSSLGEEDGRIADRTTNYYTYDFLSSLQCWGPVLYLPTSSHYSSPWMPVQVNRKTLYVVARVVIQFFTSNVIPFRR